MKFALIDAANLFNRAHHVCQGDAYTKAAMAMHIIFQSLGSVYRRHNIDHVVICGEGKSWRFDYYKGYKANRRKLREQKTEKEKEEQEVYYEVLADFMEYMSTGSRCTVVQSAGAEADDIIARFIHLHPDDEHVIVSGDSDMIQLIAPNVCIFNGVTNVTITHQGVFNEKDEHLVFSVKPQNGKLKIGDTYDATRLKKTKTARAAIKKAQLEEGRLADAEREAKALYEAASIDDKLAAKAAVEKAEKELKKNRLEILKLKAKAEEEEDYSPPKDWVELALFVKCVRGDSGDGIFSAYPGVRYKGSAKRVGIEEAWEDRHQQGFAWNNFMLQTWDKLMPDGSSEQVRVIDEYNTNKMMIDLTAQPDEVKELIDGAIVTAIQKEPVGNVGIRFLQFCQKYELTRAQDRVNDHVKYLNAGYFQ